MNGPYFTVAETAKYLKVCPAKVYDMVSKEEIGCKRIGRAIRISQKHIEAYERADETTLTGKEETVLHL